MTVEAGQAEVSGAEFVFGELCSMKGKERCSWGTIMLPNAYMLPLHSLFMAVSGYLQMCGRERNLLVDLALTIA